jgi:hypothetical protein
VLLLKSSLKITRTSDHSESSSKSKMKKKRGRLGELRTTSLLGKRVECIQATISLSSHHLNMSSPCLPDRGTDFIPLAEPLRVSTLDPWIPPRVGVRSTEEVHRNHSSGRGCAPRPSTPGLGPTHQLLRLRLPELLSPSAYLRPIPTCSSDRASRVHQHNQAKPVQRLPALCSKQYVQLLRSFQLNIPSWSHDRPKRLHLPPLRLPQRPDLTACTTVCLPNNRQ